jgi:hypothetical protein
LVKVRSGRGNRKKPKKPEGELPFILFVATMKRAAQSPIDSQRKTKKAKKEVEIIPDEKTEFLEVSFASVF